MCAACEGLELRLELVKLEEVYVLMGLSSCQA
jgi:hypothetical protein